MGKRVWTLGTLVKRVQTLVREINPGNCAAECRRAYNEATNQVLGKNIETRYMLYLVLLIY